MASSREGIGFHEFSEDSSSEVQGVCWGGRGTVVGVTSYDLEGFLSPL